MTAKNPYLKYKNPDKRCIYPFDPSPIGYCWSFAHHVDGMPGYEDMVLYCEGCDCFKDVAVGKVIPKGQCLKMRECSGRKIWAGNCEGCKIREEAK